MEETEIYPQRKIYNKYYILNIFIIYIIYYYISKYLLYIYIYIYFNDKIYKFGYISIFKNLPRTDNEGKNRSVEKDKKDSKGLKRVDSKKI